MPSSLPSSATSTYEALRQDVLQGSPCHEGRAALRYHGMLPGLRILLQASTPTPIPTTRQTSPRPASDPELVRLLANLVLQTYSEVAHVC
ncbi:hypothetical protein [Acidithiobacillus ferrivorans]|uniref:hypothetical protein n=1 Tax=Acidithiobacillus ferrivorans TaxID=160808 RepID=UPI001C07851D|nr:hypothetical protein [Acidithiobacillus ferrivorans]MBU2851556.1 hypothetical protein [Acidithiobacillus ferrivorans]